MRTRRFLTVLVATGVILAACGSDDDGATTPGGGTTASGGTTAPGGTAAAGPIKQGGTLRIVAQKPAGPLDPVAMADLGTYFPVVTAFEYLVDALGGDVRPMLAESWKPNADGSVWTFVLRQKKPRVLDDNSLASPRGNRACGREP